MQLNTLKRKTKRTASTQIGRGGRRGKTSGRGTKGQKARAGHKIRPEMRDIIKKLPKLRGRGKNSFKSFVAKPCIVNVGALDVFEAGAVVNPAALIERGIIRGKKGTTISVKILGDGVLSKKLTIEQCTVSANARVKIKKAGGEVK